MSAARPPEGARRIHVDRIALRLHGLPVAQAEWLAAQLQGALLAQAGSLALSDADADGEERAGSFEEPDTSSDRLHTSLTGDALTQAVAARLLLLIGQAAQEPPWR